MNRVLLVIPLAACLLFLPFVFQTTVLVSPSGPLDPLAALPPLAEVGVGSIAAAPQRSWSRSPAQVVLLTYPKTASTSIYAAIERWNKRQTPTRGGALGRFHWPTPELSATVRAKNCTKENWCLIISTVRKPGAQLISYFVWDACHNTSNPECAEVLRGPDEVVDRMFFEYARPRINALSRWWSEASRLLKKGGLDFNVADLGRDGFAVLPGALWLVLRFEEVDCYQANLGKWFPGIRVDHLLDHREFASNSQHLAQLRAETRWPLDLKASMLASESMRLFYPGEEGLVKGEGGKDKCDEGSGND